MKLHKAILDIAARLVHLSSPVHGKVTLHLSVISRIKASLHNVVERSLEEICRGKLPQYHETSITVHGYGYDRLLLVANGWGAIHPVPYKGPTTPG
jgi:hypothetical protein